MRASKGTEQQVVAALDDWAAAYGRKDADAYATAFGDDDDVLLFGTGSDEVVAGRKKIADLLRRDFEEADELLVRLGEVQVSAAGDVAWAATRDAVIEASVGGQKRTIPLRITAVLQRTDGRWLIQHAHVSAPLAGQEPGKSFPTGH
jgi:PhnB protein